MENRIKIKHITIGLLILIAVISCKKKQKDFPIPSTKKEAIKNSNWPIYRGNSRLTGYTQTGISNNIKLLSKFRTQKAISSSPIIFNEKVYIGSRDGYLYSLDLKTLKLIWRYKSDGPIEAPPLIYQGVIFCSSLKGTVFALNAISGKLKWKKSLSDKILGSGNILKLANGLTRLIVGSYDNMLYSLDMKTGHKVWSYKTENYINGTPAIVGTKIVFGGCDAKLHIVDGVSGEKIHIINIGSYIAGSVALFKSFAFVGHYKGEFLCIDINTKKIIWKYGNEEDGSPFFSSPAIGQGFAIVGSRDKKLHSIKMDSGKRAWIFQTRGIVDSSPVIAGDKVIVGSEDGRIYIIDLFRGLKLWSYDIGATITGSPAVARGKIVIGASDGYVYLFGENK